MEAAEAEAGVCVRHLPVTANVEQHDQSRPPAELGRWSSVAVPGPSEEDAALPERAVVVLVVRNPFRR